MTLAALVVTYRTGPRLRECLYALAGDTDIAEIVILDNGNTPAEHAFITGFCARFPRARHVDTGGNIGFGAAVNRGARETACTHLLVINPDAVLKRGSASRLRDVADANAQPAIAGGRIFGVDGVEQRGARRLPLTRLAAMGLSRWTLEREPLPLAPVPVAAVSGALFVMRRDAFLSLGGFDEGYFLHVEDIDLCVRAVHAGGAVRFVPDACALHYGQTSDAPNHVIARHKAASLSRYFRKFPGGPMGKAVNIAFLPLMRFALTLRGR
jgi:GT2 family glycosyltransferase